jgi:HlyD family secretion protein
MRDRFMHCASLFQQRIFHCHRVSGPETASYQGTIAASTLNLDGALLEPRTVPNVSHRSSRLHKRGLHRNGNCIGNTVHNYGNLRGSLVEFDRQAQLRDWVDKRAQSDDQNGKVLEAQAAEAAARAKDETDVESAQSALSKAELEMQKVELMSRIDAEKAREDLDEAHATLAQLKETFDLKRKAAQASIRILEIQRDRTQETMLHAQNNAALMQIRSPLDGIVVFNTIWKQGNIGEVQEGDQVRPGVPFMQVVDPSVMQVHVQVNQEDLTSLSVGQRACVHLDAYPDLEFTGKLESIDPMGKGGDFSSKLRTFSATFSIQGNDARLMPDLSAAVAIEVVNANDKGQTR